MTGETADDMRFQILPVLLEMARDYQPWGAGLGAFEQAYRMAEPKELLVPNYFNHAHNDWLQFVIEGGLLALMISALLAVAILAQMTRTIRSVAKEKSEYTKSWVGFAILIVVGLASLFDYPLRVPAMMVVAMIALVELLRDQEKQVLD